MEDLIHRKIWAEQPFRRGLCRAAQEFSIARACYGRSAAGRIGNGGGFNSINPAQQKPLRQRYRGLGAEPLFFLDYLGTGKLEPQVFTEIIKRFRLDLRRKPVLLIGGEPRCRILPKRRYDVSGTIVGVGEKIGMLTQNHPPGERRDRLASAAHTNGYSSPEIFFEQLKLSCHPRSGAGKTPDGAELLKVHVSYGNARAELLRKFNPAIPGSSKGLAHITAAVCRQHPASCPGRATCSFARALGHAAVFSK